MPWWRPPYETKIRAKYFLGIALRQLGQTEKSREILTDYLREVLPRPDMLYCAGVACMELDDRERGLAYWQKAVQKLPRFPEAHYEIGGVLLRQGRTTEALTHLSVVVPYMMETFKSANHPAYAPAYNRHGLALGRSGRWPEATRCLQRAVELTNGGSISFRADLASALYAQGNQAEASKMYAAIQRDMPDWPQGTMKAAVDLAAGPLARRDPLRAVELAEQACQASDFKNSEWLDALALTYAAAGRVDDARAAAQKALGLATAPGLVRQIQQRLESLPRAHQ